MKLMWLDKRKFYRFARAQGVDDDMKVQFKEVCILSMRYVHSMQCQYFHYWSDGLELCNNELMGDIKNGEFPIIRSATLRELLNNSRIDFLIKLGLMERKNLDDDWVKLNRKCNVNAKYYYLFTQDGNDLFNGDWTTLKKAEAKYIDERVGNKMPLLYRQIRDNLTYFEYGKLDKTIILPKLQKRVCRKYKNTCISDERVDQLAEMSLHYAQEYSKLDESAIKYTVSTDMERWGGRIYSHYSQTNSIMRNYIVWKKDPNDPLIQLDFKTFQMHCLVYAMEKDFGIKDFGLFKKHLKNDFDRADVYKTLTMIYQVMDKNKEFVDRDDEIQQARDDLKYKIFGAVYGRINTSSLLWEAIKGIYPEFADGLVKMKTIPKTEFQKRMIIKQEDYQHNCHKQAPFLASFYEVKFFTTIWRHLIKQKINFIPIHDAILVPKSISDSIETFMKVESTKFFGYELLIEREEMNGFQDE